MSNDQWYYAQNGQRIGPVSMAAVQSLLQSGSLGVHDYVWTAGMANWSPAGTVPELAAATVTSGGTQVGASSPAYVTPAPQGYGAVPPAYGQPVGYYTPTPYAAGAQYAGFWLRFVAWFLDSLIMFGINLVVGFAIGFVFGITRAAGGNPAATMDATVVTLVANVVSFIINFTYFTVMESGPKQSTWGKRALGLCVTNEAGGRITYGQAAGRYFGKIISGIILCIGYMMAGWTERKQALHDMMAGTFVIKRM